MLENINDIGSKLELEDVMKLERSLGVRFPKEFSEFLVRSNGGEPEENRIDFNGDKLRIDGAEIGYFYGIDTGSEDIAVCYELISSRLPDGFVPFADTAAGNFFLISTKGDTKGRVYYKDSEIDDGKDRVATSERLPNSIVEVSSSFDEFIKSIY